MEEARTFHMPQTATRALYRDILRTAQRWPSIRRAKVIEEIRAGALSCTRLLLAAGASRDPGPPSATEFRENRNVKEPEQLDKLLAEARTGLAALRSQSGLSSKASDVDFKFGDF